ncbi:MAG TPA: N-acetylmuramoyl-L-alanine amidase [Candidatus Obscuribacterales bacterium]
MFRPLFAMLALLLFACLGVSAQEMPAARPLPVSSIQEVAFDPTRQVVRLLSSEVLVPKIQYLSETSPGKIVLDLPNAIFPRVKQEIAAASPAIDKIRISQFQNAPPTVRMVLDLARPLEVTVRSRRLESGFETRIEPVATETDPNQRSGKQQLLDLRLVGQNLVLEGNAPIYPEMRQLNRDRSEYLLTLYDFTTRLDGLQPKLQSPLLESVTVLQESKGVQIRLRLKRKDIELIPFSADQFCTLQFLVKASERDLAKFTDLQVDELDQQTTRLRLFADKSFDYQIYPLENPNRLVIDTLGTALGQLALERKLKNSQNIRSVRFIPTQQDHMTDVRVVLDLYSETVYQFNWRNGYLEILLQGRKRQQEPVQNQGPVRAFVVVDPGHGGNDPGALGQSRNQEKAVTLAVSQYLARYLENDRIQVVLTREEDLEVLLQPRVDVANLRNADIFVSIHCNSMPPNNTDVHGIETYYTTPQSLELANTLHKYLVTELGAPDRRVRKRGLFVTRKTKMPSVLMEIGFLSNPNEEALLANPAYQRRVAKAIRDGIYDYLSRHQKLRQEM